MAQIIYLTKDGEQVSFDREPAAVIQTLRNGKYAVTFSREKEPRSLSQNALMWMWFDCIASQCCVPSHVVHDYYCTIFLHSEVELFDGKPTVITETTRHLSKERMTEFLNNVHAHALQEGIDLPYPEDRYFEQFFETYK